MSTVNISVPFDEEKLKALNFTLSKDNSTAQQRIEKMVIELYEETVPEALREYLDSKSAPAAPKPKRPVKPAAPKPQTAPVKPSPSAAPTKEDEKNG